MCTLFSELGILVTFLLYGFCPTRSWPPPRTRVNRRSTQMEHLFSWVVRNCSGLLELRLPAWVSSGGIAWTVFEVKSFIRAWIHSKRRQDAYAPERRYVVTVVLFIALSSWTEWRICFTFCTIQNHSRSFAVAQDDICLMTFYETMVAIAEDQY